MIANNFITLSNQIDNKENYLFREKNVIKPRAIVTFIASLCIGTNLFFTTTTNSSSFGCNYTNQSYITYNNIIKKDWLIMSTNNTIDLLQQQNLEKIEKISLFENDWNGNGGMTFSQKALSLFRQIIMTLKKQPQIAPTGRNSLLMQYELNTNLLAFEVSETTTEKVFVPNNDFSLAQTEIFTENIIKEIYNSVERFYESEKN